MKVKNIDSSFGNCESIKNECDHLFERKKSFTLKV